ncbi:methyltransferase domain-containing protein [uncultured Cohaesibacter sp.]|uniref:class I SAM-dependent methyltransferase n=1 Tax=uncultured Cohaesibacter sp. TaxID=1002546 RepID=UPI002A0A3481|nr:methyltransferase domain-containing protein [uncultured Cohaesibacter sp.]
MTDVSNSYNEQAAMYDSVIEKLVPDYEVFNTLISEVIGCPETILDVGCGTGNTLLRLLERHPSARLTGLDTSSAMIEAARIKLEGRVDLHNISVEEFQTEHSFDVITSVMVMHNLKSLDARRLAYGLFHNALANGGVYATVDIFKGECERSEKLFSQMWREFLLEDFSEEEVDNKWLALHKAKDMPLRLSDQIALLKEVGFSNVDVVHKRLGFGLILAHR